MLWHHKARVNSHQRWKQTRFRVCFHLWCELTSTMRCNGMTSFMEFLISVRAVHFNLKRKPFGAEDERQFAVKPTHVTQPHSHKVFYCSASVSGIKQVQILRQTCSKQAGIKTAKSRAQQPLQAEGRFTAPGEFSENFKKLIRKQPNKMRSISSRQKAILLGDHPNKINQTMFH